MKLTPLPLPPTPKKKKIVHSIPEYKKNDIKFENFYKFVNYKHFNMLSISNAFKIIGPYVYTASIDLTDAFFWYLYILLIDI